jgi:membrane protease YdiL (CAAX protease family)
VLLLYFVLAFGLAWLIWSPAVLATLGLISTPLPLDALTALLISLGAFGPLVAALVVTARADGRSGGRRLLARGLQWRTLDLAALALIVGLPLLASALGRALDTATGGSPPPFALGTPLALLPTFLFILLLGGPIQEEFGWRGYALDRLLARWGVWGAA